MPVRRLLLVAALGLFLAMGAMLLPLASAGPAQAQEPTPSPTIATLVRVSPNSQTLPAGTDVIVEIYVDDVASLAAYEFALAFDSGLLSYVSVTNGTFLGSTGRAVTCLPPILEVGAVRFGCVTFAPPPPDGPTGSGLLATVRLSSSCSGSSALALTRATLGDALGASIATGSQSGVVTITGGGVCPTPTITPTPGAATPTPTPTATPTDTPVGPTPTPVPQLCPPAAGAAYCILPASQSTYAGGQVTVQVAVDNVTNLGAFQFSLVYDETLLAAVDVTNGAMLGSTGRSVVCLPAFEPGRVQFACSTLGTEPPGPNGSGIVAEVTLEGLDGPLGLSLLWLQNAQLLDITSASIPVTAVSGAQVNFGVPPTATTTSTPTPTATTTDTPLPTFTPTACPTSGCPTPTDTATPSVTPTSTNSPTVQPTATATPAPFTCGGAVVLVVCVEPIDQDIAPGATAVVEVQIANAPELGAFQVSLAYAPAVVSVVDVSAGPFLSSTFRNVTCLAPAMSPGLIQYSCVSLEPTPAGPTGSGTLAVFTLRGEAVGASSLIVQDVVLADIGGAGYPPPALLHGSVSVVEPPTPSPTVSPSPTISPTVTLTSTPTHSPTPCAPEGCPTPTATTTPSITPTSSITPTPFDTPTPTSTPTATAPPTPTPLAGPLTIRVEPVSQIVPTNSLTTVDIVVDNVSNLGSFQFTLSYNSSASILQALDVGPFLGSTGRSVVCLPATIAAGQVELACATLGAVLPGPSGSGVLATATYLNFAPGSSPQHLSDPILADITGVSLSPIVMQDGLIEVISAGGTPIATATMTPTPDPTDTDGDGCSDQRENGPDETLGGRRNYLNPNDYYDVYGAGQSLVHDGVIDLPNDILGVIQHFSPSGAPPYDVRFDRGPQTGANVWNMGPPDGVIDLPNDILGVIQQFGHNCL